MDSGETEKVEIRSTSRASASVSDLVVRDGELTRIIFRPEIVDNQNDPRACIRGTFVYQKRGKNDPWADTTKEHLSTLKKGEGFQLELKSGELLPLLRSLSALYQLHRKEGIPASRVEFVKLERRLANLVELSQPQLNALLDANQGDAIRTLNGALRWAASSESLARLLRNDPDSVLALNATIGAAALQEAVGVWNANKDNDDEEFWHQVLEARPFLLSQLFHYPVVVMRGKAYVGGKQLDNRHGSIADFLCKTNTTGAALIIEIKTPCKDLLASEYRQDVYPWSPELGGALSQVLHYRDTLTQNIAHLRNAADDQIEADHPRCIVIAGNVNQELDSRAKRRSFERLRYNLHDVTVLGFDELFARAAGVLRLLTESHAGQ